MAGISRHFLLYISRQNAPEFEVHDLSVFAHDLLAVLDFIPFEDEGYVVFYSPPGASRALTRYDLHERTLDHIEFAADHRLIGCNNYIPEKQRVLRLFSSWAWRVDYWLVLTRQRADPHTNH